MKKKVEQTRITIRTSEQIVIRKLQGVVHADCSWCGKRTEMLPSEQVVTLTGISSLTLYDMIKEKQLHFCETARGHLLICLESLRTNNNQLGHHTGILIQED